MNTHTSDAVKSFFRLFATICLTLLGGVALVLVSQASFNWLDKYQKRQDLLTYIEYSVAQKCSAGQNCLAVLNDGTVLSLKMVGDIDHTYIAFGNEKMETSYFLKIYNHPSPKGIKEIRY